MKHTFKIVALVAGLFCVASASASALYWQVKPETGVEFQYARLMVTGGDLASPAYLDMVEAQGTAPNNYVPLTSTDLGAYGADAYSFFVEMVTYSGDTETIAKTSETASYTQLVSSGYVASGLIDSTTAQAKAAAANFGTNPVPEPSSGLLLLMGGAMLALRRRRQK